MDAVLLTEGCSDPLYRRAVRVSMGTVFQVPWTFLKPGIDLTEQLHELGFRTAAMALRDDSCRIDDPVLEELEKLALADEHIAAMVDVGKIVKIVCVPGRLVNIVARP